MLERMNTFEISQCVNTVISKNIRIFRIIYDKVEKNSFCKNVSL